MKLPTRSLPVALGALLAGACVSTDAPSAPGRQAQPSVFHQAPAEEPTAPVLYARDGSVVAGSGGGGAALAEPQAPQRRDVGPEGGGRMYLLELYQRVIDERDGLAQELASLQADLRQARADHAQAQARIQELEQRVQVLEQGSAALQAENLELAGRLTTAQVRRLQAEKLLLERRIAERRAQQAAASQAQESAADEGGSSNP